MGALGLAPSCPEAAALQAASVKLYRQRSRGVIGGTCTRFGEGHGLVPRLLRHRPQSAWSESNTLLSLIGQPHDPRATGGNWYGWLGLHQRPRGPEPRVLLLNYTHMHRASWLVSNQRLSHHTAARREVRQSHAASESNAAGPDLESRPLGQRATHVVPPEGIEPSPATFAGLCPVRRTVACGPDGWNRTSDLVLVTRGLFS